MHDRRRTQAGSVLRSIGLLVAFAGCATEQRRLDLGDVVLVSPLSDEATAFWAYTLVSETAEISALLDCEGGNPIEIRLLPVPAASDFEARLGHAEVDGAAGWWSSADGITIPVPDQPEADALSGFSKAGVARHEIMHALSPRLGLSFERLWVLEGAAEFIRVLDEGALCCDLVPLEIHESRTVVLETSLGDVLAWKDSVPTHHRYQVVMALTYFLVRDTGLSVPEALREIDGLTDAAVLLREEAMKAWLRGVSPAEELRRALFGDPEVAGKALARWSIYRMHPAYSDLASPELMTRIAGWVDGEEPVEWHARNVLLESFRQVPDDVIAALAGSQSPVEFLMAMALETKHGKTIDGGQVAKAWATLDDQAKWRMFAVAGVLDLPLPEVDPLPPEGGG